MIPRYVYVKDAKSALELLKDGDWDRRRAIAEYLGKEKDPIATEPLCQVLKEDQVESVRYAAAAALGEIGDSRAFESLILALKDESSGVRWSAAEALGKLGDPRAVESLVASLTDRERWVRDRAAEALGIIGDIRAVPPLVEALADEQSVIENAAGALGRLRDTRAIEPLARLLEDRRKRVQQKAICPLAKLESLQFTSFLRRSITRTSVFGGPRTKSLHRSAPATSTRRSVSTLLRTYGSSGDGSVGSPG